MNVRPLKGFNAFSDAYRAGRRGTNGPLLMSVTVRRTDHPSTDEVLTGVSISKRSARKAVVRTRVRRLLRVALRSSIERHATAVEDKGVVSVIAILRDAPTHPSLIGLADVQPLVEQLLLRILRECKTPSSADPA